MAQACHLVVRVGEDSHFMKTPINKILNYNILKPQKYTVDRFFV